jgi:hypothetical protein
VGLAALEGLVVVVGAEVRVDELDGDASLQTRLDGHEERHAEEQVRCDVLDVAGVAARGLGDVGRLREVAHAAVDHAAAVAAGAEGEVVALEDDDAQAAQGEIARDAGAVHAATDDGDVEDVGGGRARGDGHDGVGGTQGRGRVVGHGERLAERRDPSWR